MPETPSSDNISPRLRKVAELARQAPQMAFTTLAHHIGMAFLMEAYRRTRKDGAVGIDGRTAADYARDLEGNLRSLLDRFKSGWYLAPPVRRTYIPKGDGKKMRPIGIPTFEDKVLQRAVAMLLEAIYEQDFLDCSYGFRPGRSAHQALEDFRERLMKMRGGFVIEVDIQAFFDNLDHGHLRRFLDRRVNDGVIRRTIGKWLKAGAMEQGAVTRPKGGTPQGGVISPFLANVYLHEVLDVWFERTAKSRLKGESHMIRYADDVLIVCRLEEDARRLMEVLPKRFGRYGLSLHPEKTRLVRFRRPTLRASGREWRSEDRPGTFDFLGFTHYWGKSLKGKWVVLRKTAADRFRRGLRHMSLWGADQEPQRSARRTAGRAHPAAEEGRPHGDRIVGRQDRGEIPRDFRPDHEKRCSRIKAEAPYFGTRAQDRGLLER
ncbi:MAG: group II intron reverse transcriptase/maturase [Myxococcales bacterium]|nr:MAG: group II intron reverse transcriptase/maturase [Myxococcales bacterium]